MGGDQNYIAPIMTKGLNTYQFGNNAYGKPATALNILRETVMGEELFDYAFREYSQRWMFKKKYYITATPNQAGLNMAKRSRRLDENNLVFFVEEGSPDFKESMKNESSKTISTLKEYLMDNFSAEERATMKEPKYFYSVTFEKPGGLVMPIIVEYTYADGTSKTETYPAQIWRLNDKRARKAVASEKEIVKITVDPKLETADVDTSNNSWPREFKSSEFNNFKNKVKN